MSNICLAGAGKTKLVSMVVDDISKEMKQGIANDGLAYFYCDRNEDLRRDPQVVLRSLVKQLSISPRNDGIHKSLVKLFNQKKKSGFASNEMSIEECEVILPQLLEAYNQTTLIIDALDECYPSRRHRLIEILDALASASTSLKVLISSRRDDDIKYRLETGTNVGISATDNQDDISKFVVEAIEADKKTRRKPIPQELRDEIIQTLLDKSGGM